MKSTLFLITELQRPVGGLYRYVTELLPAWRKAINSGKHEFEPIAVSFRDPNAPLGDLRESKEFEAFSKKSGMKIFEAVRGGERCYFIDAPSPMEDEYDFHKLLWDKYRIKSEKSSGSAFYSNLCMFWKNAAIFAQELQARGRDIAVIDAQDWLAFPAGFLAKEKLKRPLSCRFHSGEFGRSLGNPDMDAPPVLIERAALQEADFIQGVSIDEAKFEVYNLLPLKQELFWQIQATRSKKWREEQEWKTNMLEEFLMFEPEELELVTQCAAGLPNGIILDSWLALTKEQMLEGRAMLQKLLPGKSKYVLFIGRAEYRKGIDALIEAFGTLGDPNYGLVVMSSLNDDEYRRYYAKLVSFGIESNTLLYNGWVEELMKKQLFCAADCIALPSLYEPFGLVTLEGLAADLACSKQGLNGPIVIVGGTGGMNEVIRNGVNGFKVPMEEDKFDLRPNYLARILQMSLTSEGMPAKITKGGAQRVTNASFNWEFISLRVQEVYRKAIENYAMWNDVRQGEGKD